MQMLSLAFEEENAQWKPCRYAVASNTGKDPEVIGKQRDAVVNWLAKLNDFLRFTPETLFVTVSLLDSFLYSVRAHPKYLYCIAVACFYVAIKITEEDEVIPTTQELIDVSHCGCSVAELLRMERVILKKMDWNLKRVTSLDFLHIFHGLLVINFPGLLGMNQVGAGSLLVWLGVKLKACLQFSKLAVFKPSVVALSLISLELESTVCNWLTFVFTLQKFVQVNCKDMLECKVELSKMLLNLYGPHKAPRPYFQKSPFPLNPVKRKMEQTDVEEIYDSIKRLYGDESTATPCSAAAAQDSLSSVPDHHKLTSVAAV